MLNFSLAAVLIAAIWAVLIVALLIWFFVSRSRRRAESEAGHGPARVGESDTATEPSFTHDVASALDLTQPVERLQRRGASAPVTPPAATGATPEPFGLTTQREYERLAAEPFQAPPAAALGERHAAAPFSWEEATSSGPRRAAGARKPTGITNEPVAPATREAAARNGIGLSAQDPAAPIAPAPGSQAALPPDLDRTVVVARTAASVPSFGWSLMLPDGDLLRLTPDCVVGRRPTAIEGADSLVIADPTRTLSKSHARLRFDGELWWVTDLASTNGLWLLHSDGREEGLQPYRETEATERLRLGTLDVEIRRDGDRADADVEIRRHDA